ncbi:interaptin-like [Lolium rigidum]|uniref:interaptin-like n=1 Tax=Lolium rigidum TaxID=89674 RepID=UPI001F5C54DE|nr:interaptin-like [Lolium rigidum]
MRRFFFFGSSTSNEGNGSGTPGEDGKSKHKSKKAVEEGEGNANSSSRSDDRGARISRSRSRRGKLNNEEPSNPRQLRRCMSFSSAATNSCLKERSFSFSGDVPGSFYNESDAPHHAEDVNHYAWSPERHPVSREHSIKVPKAHSVLETDSPRSRCHSCSTGHSPPTSPVALRCRSTRLGNLLNKNEVLDRYIEGEQEAAIQSEKRRQSSPTRSVGSSSRRPPRPHYAVPSFQKSVKESLETYPNVNGNDAYLHQLAQERANDSYKNTTLSNASKNHASVLDDFGRFPHVEDYKSESFPSVEDIYEDFQDVQLSNVIQDAPQNYHDNDMDFALEEQETDGKLLQRAKEVEERFIALSGDSYELNMSRYKRLSSNEMFQLLQCLTEDRRQLADELSSQIKARLTERFNAKEQYKRSMKESDIRARKLEKEKTEMQSALEREIDRRSNDWSARLSRFQSEEERLRERVRELAEKNVSFQRELTSIEANRVDASEKVASLEMQNIKLTDELEKVRKEHDNLQKSSVELHAQFTKVAEEKGHIRGFLKDKDGDNKALHQVVARLQTICNEQEKTIAGLRQGFSAELDKESAGCSSERKSRMQIELIRLTGVEQKLRGEVQSRRLEVEALRQENIALLNRLQSTENGSSFSSIRFAQELQARVDNLQIQGLSLLDKTSQLCTKLLDLVKCRRHENEHDTDIDALDYTLEFQSIKAGIENMKRSLRATNAVLAEKQNLIEKSGEAAAGGTSPRVQKDELYLVDSEFKLKEEALLSRVLKEALLSKELDIEQLQSDVASLLRLQDVMRNEVQRVQDELSCITHKAKHMELQGSKKDESINQIQQDFQESSKELSSLRGQLKIVTDERDLSWQEAKQLRRTTTVMQNEIGSLKKKIESLEEDILVKEGQISILQDNIYKPPLDFICSPTTMKQFGME